MSDHTMRPECAEKFAELLEARRRAKEDRREAREDLREIDSKIDQGFLRLETAIATLQERSRNWGVIGGLISSLGVSVIAAIVLSVIL